NQVALFETPALIIRALFQIFVEALRQVELRGVVMLGISSCSECRAKILCGFLSLALLLFPSFRFCTSWVTETLLLLVFPFAFTFALVAASSPGATTGHTWHAGHPPACCHTFHHLPSFPK